MEINRSDLFLSQVSGGTSKGSNTASSSESNSVVVLNLGTNTTVGTTTISLPGLNVKA